MENNDERFGYSLSGAKLGGQIYWNAINALREVWFEIYGETIEISVSGKAGFRRLLDEIKYKLVEKHGVAQVAQALNEQGYDLDEAITADQLLENLLEPKVAGITSVDDITPNEFKGAIYHVAELERERGNESEDVPLDVFLRRALDHLWKTKGLSGRFNVGENRHFPRMFQWVKEVAAETDWGDEKGLRLLNASKRGAIKANPAGPKGLLVRLNFNAI